MKMRICFVLIISITTLCLSGTLQWEINAQGGRLQGSLPKPHIESITSAETEYRLLTLPNASQSGLPGAFAWPVLQRMVQLPASGNLSCTPQQLHYTELPLDAPLAPFNWQDDASTESRYTAQDAWLPANPVEIAPAAIMRGIRFTSVSLHPVQYNPARQTIRYLTNLDIQFQLDASRTANPLQSRSNRQAGCFAEMAHTMLDYQPASRTTTPEKYLFICPDNVMQVILTLAQWKQKLGFLTHITPMSEIGSETADLQNYLQTAYDTWDVPPTYVILFGDVTGNFIIPSYYIPGGFIWMDVTDHPYTLLEGDDYFPDIMLGRITFQNQMQLMTAVSKIINYESNPYEGEWANSTLSLSYVMPQYYNIFSHRETVMSVRDMFIEDEFAVCDTFIHPYNYGQDALADMINSGYAILNTRVTGSHDHWVNYSGYEFFNIQDVQNLANGFMLPLVASITCGGGDFASQWEPTNFGETWLTAGTPAQPKGCIAFIGPSEYDTQTGWNNALDTGIFEGYSRYNLRRCGQMMLHGKMALYNNYPYCHEMGNSHNSDQFYFHVYGLLGDPGLQVLSKVPQQLQCAAPDTLQWGASYLDASVTLPDGSPVAGATIAITNALELLASATTNEAGNARIYYSFLDKGLLTLTASCYNQRPVSQELRVIQSQGLSLQNLTFQDPVTPASTVAAAFEIANTSLETISDISISLDAGEHLTISPQTITISEISAMAHQLAEISISCDALWQPEAEIDCTALASSSAGEQEFHFLLPLSAPELSMVEYEVLGSDSCLVQNQQSQIHFCFINSGSVASGDISMSISALDDRLQLISSEINLSSLAPGQTGWSSAVEVLPHDVITGQTAHVQFDVTDQNLSVWSTAAHLPIGHISAQAPTWGSMGYMVLESSDIGHPDIPQYSWIELDPDLGGLGMEMTADYSTSDGYTKIVQLPFDFSYYGEFYHEVSINSNGWLSMGRDEFVFFRNRAIPSAIGASGMIAPFWDHLDGGKVFLYLDAANHQFIVEWKGWHSHDANQAEYDTFEVILRDPAHYPTATGNGEILMQYQSIDNVDSDGNYATIGIENHQQTDGIQLSYANFDAPTFHPIAAETAILITSIAEYTIPMLAVQEPELSFTLQPDLPINAELTISNPSLQPMHYELSLSHFSPLSRSTGRSIENDNIFIMGNSYVHHVENDQLFYLIHNSPDGEAIQGVRLEFPDGTEVLSATDIGSLAFNGETGNNASPSWGFGNGAPISPVVPQSFTLRYMVDSSVTDPIEISWYIQGDGSGAAPHSASGTCTIVPSDESFIWITYPSGGEQYMYGLQDSVNWMHYGDFSTVHLDFSTDEGHNWQTLLTDVPNTDHLEYTIPGPLTSMGKVRLRAGDESCSSISSGLFSVSALSIYYPTAQCVMQYGTPDSLCWDDLGGIDYVDIQISQDGGVNWQNLAEDQPNTGSYSFTVPGPPSNLCHLRVISEDGEIHQTSPRFEIVDSPVTWISLDTTQGTVEPQSSATIGVSLDASGLQPGNYTAYCIITSAIGQRIVVPVELTVSDTPPVTQIVLAQNRPNPFNPFTRIDYELKQEGKAKITVFNSRGQKVRTLVNQVQSAGAHYCYWDGTDTQGSRVPSGVYYYQLNANGSTKARKMTLLK
jgi:hypothetical protein